MRFLKKLISRLLTPSYFFTLNKATQTAYFDDLIAVGTAPTGTQSNK